MDTLLESLADWKPFTAVVVGDFMLDQIVRGDASRLSPDAPVPVLRVADETDRPGGAANLCLDLVALRGTVHAVGVTGDDANAARLRESLESRGVQTAGLIADRARPTTVKRSLVGLAQARHPQKMFRLDTESNEPIGHAVVQGMLDRIDALLADADAVCIEDYAKGVCSEALCQGVIERAKAASVPVFVDPAMLEDYARYRGATAITPNRTEAEHATGLPTAPDTTEDEMAVHNAELAKRLGTTLDLEAVVLTLDRHGSLLMTDDSPDPTPVPTVAREVYDVTGAGDMMLAGLAAARANGIGWEDSVRFANAAAGLEVEIFGVEPIPLEKVHHELLVRHGKMDGKLRTLDQLLLELSLRRGSGETIVFTNGCFDVLHAGHVRLLAEAASHGDFLVVGLNSDDSVRRLKGADRPVNCESDRAEVLGALEAVGAVCVFGDDTPAVLIDAVAPDVLVKGADYAGREVVGRESVERAGGKVVLIDLLQGRSTTGTIAKLRGEGSPTGS
ncbi:MAG: D-glycero-beta-D-manno-heptose 1-phosphate adenylyltransferase [Planctomycetota bacterium]